LIVPFKNNQSGNPACRKNRNNCQEAMKAGASGWIGVAYDGAQVSVDDSRAIKWMNTRTYDSLSCKPPAEYLENTSKRIPKEMDVCGIGAARKKRKTRKTKRSRRVTRRRL
jgi:hypothetical protein